MPDNNAPIRYNPLDPAYEQFYGDMPVPNQPARMKFSVRGYEGGGFGPRTPQGRAATCYAAVARAINIGSVLLDRDVAREWKLKEPSWPRISSLTVYPEAGEMWNAFYNRNSLRFFFNTDEIRHKPVYASASARIVTHEAGHGLLDAIRPDLWNYTNFEVWSFHEAFGDVLSTTLALQDPLVAKAMLDANGGDLKKPNLVSGMAPEFGSGVLKAPIDVVMPLRDLCNGFLWQLPGSLPPKAPNDQLAAEPHSFSRVFTGACYDLMVGLFDFYKGMPHANTNHQPYMDLQDAANVMTSYLITGAALAPVNERFFDCVAKAMIFVDIQHHEPHRELLYKVFNDRKILQPAPPAALSTSTLVGVPYKGKQHSAPMANGYVKHQSKTVKLDDFITIQSENPLNGVSVDVPMEHFEVDDHPELTIHSDPFSALDSARTCVHWVQEHGKHKGRYSQFRVKDNKLVRKHFSCCFHT